MSNIWITGDTHGNIDKIIKHHENHKIKSNFKNENDIYIVAGDFGLIWNMQSLNFENMNYNQLAMFEKKYPKLTLLFVDGNHENFDILYSLPVIDKFNGKVTKITNNVFHLRRGEIYNILNNNIFTFGGALSIDRHYRIPKLSWWEQEIPTTQELNYAINNINTFLSDSSNTIDYIITHTCPEPIHEILLNYRISNDVKKYDPTYYALNTIYDLLSLKFKTWFFGHFHKNLINFKCTNNNNFTLLYNDFKLLK